MFNFDFDDTVYELFYWYKDLSAAACVIVKGTNALIDQMMDLESKDMLCIWFEVCDG